MPIIIFFRRKSRANRFQHECQRNVSHSKCHRGQWTNTISNAKIMYVIPWHLARNCEVAGILANGLYNIGSCIWHLYTMEIYCGWLEFVDTHGSNGEGCRSDCANVGFRVFLGENDVFRLSEAKTIDNNSLYKGDSFESKYIHKKICCPMTQLRKPATFFNLYILRP